MEPLEAKVGQQAGAHVACLMFAWYRVAVACGVSAGNHPNEPVLSHVDAFG
jgi:hypothetical protein